MTDGDLILHIANWINKLKPDHRAHKAFGSRLQYLYEQSLADNNNTVFLYNFPLSVGVSTDAESGAALHSPLLAYMDNTPALAIVPEISEPPTQSMNAWNYYFSLLCRHSLPGCAYRCLYYLTLELNNNARVFPQNGVIFALTSQPATIWNDRRGLTVYKSTFKAMSAEPIL